MSSRRRFLRDTLSFGVASKLLGTAGLTLGATAARADGHGYRALVCVMLGGGADSYNMVIPTDGEQYDEYLAVRSDLALPLESLHPIAPIHDGRSFAMHPGMVEMRDLYEARELAVLANIGTLVEPYDQAAVDAGTAKIPLGLFSHADQIEQWQTAVVDARIAAGWAGRIADLTEQEGPANGISMNISVSGTNVFQSGQASSPYAISVDAGGARGLFAYADGTDYGNRRKEMVDRILGVPQTNLFREEYVRRLRGAIDAQQIFTNALDNGAPLETTFSDNDFSQALALIARTIAGREGLGASRQTFFVNFGGWDHHDGVVALQAQMLPVLSRGLKEFRDAMVELGVFGDVTTFTVSDFARTLTSNGKGSDHAWGGHHFVMGGGVNGGAMVGDYPLIYEGSPLALTRGIYAPTQPVEAYFMELAHWFGVSSGDMAAVLPNVGRFFDPATEPAPLGFMNG